MQASLTDKKLSVIFDRYKDNEFAASAQKEVEDIRRKALTVGAATTGGAFVLNELARLTMRSPVFKLKVQNVLFWLFAPTVASKYYYDCHIHERIDGLWRVHQNRVDRGLGATYNATGVYANKGVDANQRISNGVHLRLDQITHGILETPYLDNPFQRFNESIEAYPDFHDDIDDVSMINYDSFERLKPFQPKEGTTAGATTIIPPEDNDTKLYFYDVQGESVYTNPPDANAPLIDHGLDEDHIWAFNVTGYNQQVVKNQYLLNPWAAAKNNHVPYWGQKLLTPSFFKEDKMAKFNRHWAHRLGLENLKIRQAIQAIPGDKQQAQRFKEEIEAYIASAYEAELQEELKEVYVTDHSGKQQRFATLSKKDDETFFRYKQALSEYNAEAPKPLNIKRSERYERGTLLQRVFDPLAGAERDANGTLVYTLQDKELLGLNNEEKLRAEFERLKAATEGTAEFGEDDHEALRAAIIEELESNQVFDAEEFQQVLDREFSVFKNGEKYDFVRDLKQAYAGSLEKPAAARILDTIPEHAFWDIKTPLVPAMQKFMNPYNPFREYHTQSFFDAREYEQYMENRTKKQNLVDGVSTRRRY